MYGMIFGTNPMSDILLAALDLTRADVGRFRDAWVTENGEIAVYTRNGGGNRECWSEQCCGDCTGCTMSNKIPQHPAYLRDQDDDFDCTYATIFYSMPEKLKPFAEALAQKRDPNQEWLDMLTALTEGKKPEVVEKFRPLMEKIAEALQGQPNRQENS